MISFVIYKLDRSGVKCDNDKCQHSPQYHDHIIGNNFYIKTNSICLLIKLGITYEYYCRDCIDLIYQKFKPVLDSKLWVFK